MPDQLATAREAMATMPARAVAAAQAVARRLGIDARAAYPIRTSFSVFVHLAPSPVAARVAVLTPLLRHDNASWLGREVRVAAGLAAAGVPVVRPVDLEVHRVDELDVSLWEYVEHDPHAVVSAAEFGTMLGELHAAMRDLPAGLTDQRLPALDDLLMSGVPATEVAAIAASLPERPVQILHGDAHARNLMRTPRGWLWHDFEETCVGPIEWDLGVLARSRLIDGLAAMRHYPGAPPYSSLQPWLELRARQVALWDHLATALPQ